MANRIKQDDLIKEIKNAKGNLSLAAQKLRVSRVTIYKYIEKYPAAKEALENERESMIDNVETTLYSQALAGNTTAMIFFLKTQGKSRGYVERNEITGKDGNDVTIRVVYDE